MKNIINKWKKKKRTNSRRIKFSSTSVETYVFPFLPPEPLLDRFTFITFSTLRIYLSFGFVSFLLTSERHDDLLRAVEKVEE